MMQSDSELIERIRKGNKRLFALLVDRYKDRAMTLAVRMLRSREDAEEAAQDAFIRAYNALDKFEGSSRFGTWLYRIVYNVCLTRLAKRKEEFVSIDDEDNKDLRLPELYGSSQLEYESTETIAIIKKAIETLPLKYRTVLSLFYLQELSHEEICEVTQLPLGTVKTHLFRARSLLYDLLTKQFEMEKIPV